MLVYKMGTLIPGAAVVEDDTSSLLSITPEHAMVHAGKGFRAAIKTGSLAQNASYYIQFATGAKEVHLKPITIAGGQNMDLVLTEGFTSTVGSAYTVVNSNRKHSSTSTVTITNNVTLGTAGTEIDRDFTGVGNARGAVLNNGGDELYLKANTIYGIKVTNTDGNAAAALVKMFWYEPH